MDTNRTHRAKLLTSSLEWAFSYVDLYDASPIDRIRLAKNGTPTATVRRMAVDLGLSQKMLRKALNLKSLSTIKKTGNDKLPIAEGERVLGLARLIGQVEAMVQESGEPTGFNATTWLSGWLQEPLPALGGEKTIDLLDTMEGQALVSCMLVKIQSGAFA